MTGKLRVNPVREQAGACGQAKWHRLRLAALLMLYTLLAGWYSVRTPVGEGVDEGAHFAYVQYIAEQRRLPVLTTEGLLPVAMAHHPPLYYLLGAPVVALFDTSDAPDALRPNPHFVWRENDGRDGWNVVLHYGQGAFPWRGTVAAIHALRTLSVMLGALTVAACYATARLLLPRKPWAPLGAAALVALNPSFLYTSSTVHHDPLIICLVSLGILHALYISHREPRRADPIVAGLLVGAATLAKLTGLILLPMYLLALALRLRGARGWRVVAGETVILGVGVGIIAGWWFLRNQILYGDILGWQMFRQIFSFNFRQTSYSWGLFRHELLAQLGRTFWGAFGFMHITFPEFARFFWWAVALAGVGLIISLLDVATGRVRRAVLAPWLIPLSALALVLGAVVRFSVESTGAGHVRYVFPAASAFAPLLIVGLNRLAAWRAQRVISLALVAGLCAYAVWLPMVHVWPRYAPPREVSQEELAGARPLALDFEGGIRLVAYTVHPPVATPGSWLTLTLYWQATGEPEDRSDPYAHVALVSDDGERLDARSFWPDASTSPIVWLPGQTIASRVPLYSPARERAGNVAVELGLVDGRDGMPLAALDPTSQLPLVGSPKVATLVAPGALVAVSSDAIPHPRAERIGQTIGLAGYDLAPWSLSPGGTLVVLVYWEVHAKPPADWTVFVHLVNEQGAVIAQFDGPPGGGQSPTSTWERGELWMDSYPVILPEDLVSGSYRLLLGMYTWPDLVRQRIYLDGQDVGDSVVLEQLVVP